MILSQTFFWINNFQSIPKTFQNQKLQKLEHPLTILQKANSLLFSNNIAQKPLDFFQKIFA